MKTIATVIAFLLILGTSYAQNGMGHLPSANLNVEDGETTLRWQLEKEANTSYFIIQASKNNQAFETIATQPAAGYALQGTHYAQPIYDADTNTQYRVVLIYMDGSRVTSACTTYDPATLSQFAASNQ